MGKLVDHLGGFLGQLEKRINEARMFALYKETRTLPTSESRSQNYLFPNQLHGKLSYEGVGISRGTYGSDRFWIFLDNTYHLQLDLDNIGRRLKNPDYYTDTHRAKLYKNLLQVRGVSFVGRGGIKIEFGLNPNERDLSYFFEAVWFRMKPILMLVREGIDEVKLSDENLRRMMNEREVIELEAERKIRKAE